MKKTLVSAMMLGLFSSGAAIASDNPEWDAAQARLDECKQEAMAKGEQDVYAYIYACLDKKLEYK